MTEDGNVQRGPGSPSGATADDIVEHGGGPFPSLNWRPSRGGAILAAAGLAAGLAIGYMAGERQAGSSAVAPQHPRTSASASASPQASTAAGDLALTEATGGCSAQIGRGELQLGVQVVNQSAAEVTLSRVKAVLPLGGLRAISQQWAPCGALPAGHDLSANRVPPGASRWFTVTFEVLLGCPGPLPVQFTIYYDWDGQSAAASLPGFPDLGGVPYTGCPANSPTQPSLSGKFARFGHGPPGPTWTRRPSSAASGSILAVAAQVKRETVLVRWAGGDPQLVVSGP